MAISPLSQPGASARLPDAPTSIAATAVSGGQASVSFTASTNPGKPSGNYVVTSSPGSLTASGASSPITVTGLSNGTAYTFTAVKQSGSGITSATSGASGSITAFSPPTFGTQTGSSTAATVSATTGISNVYTTTGTLSNSPGSGATFYDYQRISGTAVTPSGDSLTGLAEDTNHEWYARVTNNSSSFDLTTRVTPNGSATAVSVAFGTDGVTYGSNATSSGNTSVNIGSGLSEVSTTWSLTSSSSAATIYYRVTATYAGGATVQTTGSIARVVTVQNGTSTGVFRTYTTRTRTDVAAAIRITKPSYGANIPFEFWLTGGGGGSENPFGPLAYGGGGAGAITIQTGLTHTSGNIDITRGAGGNYTSAGGATTLTYSGGTHTAAGGNPGTGNFQGGSSGNGNAGNAGNGVNSGGGGGGFAGPATGRNGGPGNAFSQQAGGGPGFSDSPPSHGSYVDCSGSLLGCGGRGRETGVRGYFNITYVGPEYVIP